MNDLQRDNMEYIIDDLSHLNIYENSFVIS